MANQEVSLDQITWRSPNHVQAMGGYLHSNNILFYFAESPFFDSTSNNASLSVQAMYNENFRHFVETREAFEARLRTMQGLEFVVARDPLIEAVAENRNKPVSEMKEPGCVWVIKKQTRRKVQAQSDDIRVLGIYYVVGDSIFMAPSVAGVVGNRMLSTVTSLTKAIAKAAPLPLFTPSHGHTYMPPIPISLESQFQSLSQQPSKATTPTPVLGSQTPVPSKFGAGDGSFSNASSVQDARLIAEAWKLFTQYGDENMDDNPLIGEPGSFIISSKKTTAAPNEVTSRPGLGTGVSGGRARTGTSTPVPSTTGRTSTPTVTPIRADAATISKAAKGSATSEKSLDISTSAGPGGKEKIKRKKSKAGIAQGSSPS